MSELERRKRKGQREGGGNAYQQPQQNPRHVVYGTAEMLNCFTTPYLIVIALAQICVSRDYL